MQFNSPIYLFLFLPVTLLVYSIAPGRWKLAVGLLASLLFYAWGNLLYVPLIVGLAVFAWLIGLGLAHFRGRSLARFLLWGGILVNVGLIVSFKLIPGISYPLGLSFLTFQVIAYWLEIQGGKVENERNLLDFSFFLLLFPKMPVGPIVRYSQLRDSVRSIRIEPEDAAEGLRRFIRGLAKKVLIADTLGNVVTPIFNLDAPTIPPWMAWLVLASYTLQIYYDFSGYTDMAIGVGRMLGLRFMENFNLPYVSRSIGEFWRRWHISLSTWFRDFVFFPLERRRSRWLGQPINIMIVFLLTGLWHGLTANFVIWGLIHGAALVFEGSAAGRRLKTLWAPLQHAYALFVIGLAWVFFRSPTPSFAWEFLRRLGGDISGLKPIPFALTRPLPIIEPSFLLALAVAVFFSLPAGSWLGAVLHKKIQLPASLQLPVRAAGDLVLIVLLLAAVMGMTIYNFTPALYGKF
jgi:alginate O-acetyltransferase complex protein AlgI